MNDREAVAVVLAALREVVAEVGEDWVYPEDHKRNVTNPSNALTLPSCVYVHQGSPDCIAGRALARLGVPVSFLAEHEGMDVGALSLERDLVTLGFPWARPQALRTLQRAQSRSDNGSAWSEALEGAEEWAATVLA